MLHERLVVATNEFGCTSRMGHQITSAAGAVPDGRDHWPNDYTVVLAGGGIQPGAVGVPQTVWPPIPNETA